MILQPPDWPEPKGYSNGIVAEGKQIFVAGQIGWDKTHTIVSSRLSEQVKQALQNVIEVLEQANAKPEHIVRMNWFLTDKQEYLNSLAEIGQVYREVIGRHYPAMTAVEVNALIEDDAKVEIEVSAVIPA